MTAEYKKRLFELFSAHAADSLSLDEHTELQESLRCDAEARRLWFVHQDVEVGMHALLAAEPVALPDSGKMIWPSWRPLLAMAACVALLASGGWWWLSTQRVFATVVEGAGVVEIKDGAALRGESHVIAAGTVQIISSTGARIVIEAPAEFRFESAQRLHLSRGRLSAEVPPAAKGFTVVTPSGDAVDLGTRFGVDVPTTGPAEVHVFEGEVIAEAAGTNSKQSVRGGAAVSMTKGASTARDLRSSAFIQREEVPALNAALGAGQRARSDAAVATLRQDPALIALLDFESGETLPGVFRAVQGRWPGSRAPEFVSIGDHIKLDVGGARTWPQFTLAAWVRIDRLGEGFQSLLLTNGWSTDKLGQVHWQINRAAKMQLDLIGNQVVTHRPLGQSGTHSRSPVMSELGRWMHLAVVYDAVAGTVRFYLNGQLDNDVKLMTALPARFGAAQIGNWNLRDRKLSGRVDEMLILGRAMSDAEVLALFDAGDPYR